MENNQIIPNVSSVFRQLVQISHTNPRLNSYQDKQYSNSNTNPYIYQKYQNNQSPDFISNMGLDDRQKRHEQLMNRLKNSLQQNRQLFGTKQSSINPMQRENIIYDPKKSSYSNNFETYQYSNSTNTDVYQNSFNKTNQRKWTAPRLKYRHIEDFQQKETLNQSANIKSQGLSSQMENQLKLKQQFYENQQAGQNKIIKQNRQQSYSKKDETVQVNEQQINNQDFNINQQSNFSKFSKISPKPSQYGQNLQSYYELCRKPVKASSIIEKNRKNPAGQDGSDKFIRKQTPKIQGINLQKAMKILSFDD